VVSTPSSTQADMSTANSTFVGIKIAYALLIAASLIAAIRLRGEPIKPSPKLSATTYDLLLTRLAHSAATISSSVSKIEQTCARGATYRCGES
jgi:hypothetical protein